MFDPEFYPTPLDVIDQMGIDCYGKTVLEPSAGSGNIVKYLRAAGAAKVLACERHEGLRKMIADQCELIGSDFFRITSEQVSHVQMIVMNPPFSSGAAHILHAWKTAPEGCEVVALCNYDTIQKSGFGRNRELAAVIENYGESMSLGSCFKSAERATDVEVGLVRLFKPVLSEGIDMDGFYLTDDNPDHQENGLIGFNEIKAVVNSYLAAVHCFERVQVIAAELKSYTNVKIIDQDDKVHQLSYGHGLQFVPTSRDHEGITTKEDFARGYQKACWRYIFNRVGIEKYVTTGVLKDVNAFIESRQNYPFTVRNIGRMLDIIIGTRDQTMQRAIVESIDNFTRHTDENRYGIEGWKTNTGHLLNKKFITGWISEHSWGGRSLQIRSHNGNFSQITDLAKALCFITGKRFEDMPDIRSASCPRDPDGNISHDERGRVVGENQFEPNTWYDWGFFRFKVFKKGTGHFQFKSEDHWAALNRAYAKAKGFVLPEKI